MANMSGEGTRVDEFISGFSLNIFY